MKGSLFPLWGIGGGKKAVCQGGGSNGVGSALGFSTRRYSVGGGRDALSCGFVGGGFEGFFPVMAATWESPLQINMG